MPELPPDEDCSPCCTTHTPCVGSEPGPPGEQGPAGENGTNGIDGSNAYTVLTSSFVQPASSGSVVVTVVDGLWASVGQILFVQTGGYYTVSARSSTTITLTNLGYTGNASPGATIATAQQVSPAGIQGEDGSLTGAAGGSLAGTYPNPTLSLTGVSAGVYTKITVNTEGRITVGTTLIASDIPAISAATQLTGITPIANGGTAGATALAGFNNLSPLTTKGDTIVRDGTNNTRLGVGSNGQLVVAKSGETNGLLYRNGFVLLGTSSCNANTTGDTAILINADKYIVRKIVAYDASISLTTVVGGIYTAAVKGGSDIVANTQVYSALTATTKFVDLTLKAPATTDYLTSAIIYFSPTTPQGATATLTIQVWGEVCNNPSA